MEEALHAGALPEGTRSLVVEGCTEDDRVGCREGRINVCIRRSGRTRCMPEVAALGKFLKRTGNSCGTCEDANRETECPVELPGFNTVSTNPKFFGASCDFGEECCPRQPDGGGDCVRTCFPNEKCSCNENDDGSSCTWRCFSTDECFAKDPACDASCPVEFPGFDFTTSTNSNFIDSGCDYGESTCCEPRQNDAGDCVIPFCFQDKTCFCTENDGGASCTWQCFFNDVVQTCFEEDPNCPAPSCPVEVPDFNTVSTNPSFFGASCDFGEECCLRQPDGGGDCVRTCSPKKTLGCVEDADGSSCTWRGFFTDACQIRDQACF
jgi:hypothetical protein